MRETNRFFPLRGRHSLVLALLLCLTAQAGVSGEQAMAQPGPALHATASLAPIFKDSDWAAARARRNRICNEQSPDSALGRKKGAERIKDVFIMSIDAGGDVFIQLKEKLTKGNGK